MKKSRAASLCATGLLLAACSRVAPLEVFGQVPPFQLTSQSGSVFDSQKELKGHVWVADFIFTNCQGPCPRMSAQMRRLQAATPPDVKFVSITVDPERDTPPVLAEYAKKHQADGSRWSFLTGPQQELHRLKREVFLLGNVDGELNHSTRFVLIDRQSRIRGYYDTSEPESIQKLKRDIDRLRKEPVHETT
ncbi:MAG: SCO family protein [Bryobacteraceae bacterium]|nr:SCO family protein [Bryobacteraceae bacterium]MDW8376914.1 SCO family protein [Bryobacterales bacterium]